MIETGVGFNPLFFIGAVENNVDLRHEGRVQVRAFGIHGTVDQIPTNDLPWATLIIGSHDPNFVVPPINSWVFGFFMDGRAAQQPMVLGLIPTQMIDPVNPSVTGWGVALGEGIDVNATGSRPQDIGQPTQSRLARGEELENTYLRAFEANRVRNIEIAGGGSNNTASYNNIGAAGADDINQNEATSAANGTSGVGQLSREVLESDEEFQSVLAAMEEKYPGLDRNEIYAVIEGESNYDTLANQNTDRDAAGLFQWVDVSRQDLGVTRDEIFSMSAADQLRLYDRYLDFWNYNPSNSLGIMQAAPAYASRSADSIIYDVNSDGWRDNKVWRSENDGPVTVKSINEYYSQYYDISSSSSNESIEALSAAAGLGGGRTPTDGNSTEKQTVWEEPTTPYNAMYPYNRVIETGGGNVVEIDDTPGAERIMIYHKDGSYVQFAPSTTSYKAMSDKFDVTERNNHVYVGGNNIVTIEGDAHVLVNGNKTEEIRGDYKQIIHGNHSVGVAGQMNFIGSEEGQVRAARLTMESNVENLNIKVGKNIRFESGETIHFSTKNIFIKTEESINSKIGTDVILEAGGDLSLKSGGDSYLNVSGDSNSSAGGELRLQSDGKLSITSPLIGMDQQVRMAQGLANASDNTPHSAVDAEPSEEVKHPAPPQKDISRTPSFGTTVA